MSASTALIISIGFSIGSLLLLMYVNRAEEARQEHAGRLKLLTLKAEHLEDRLSDLESLVENKEILATVAGEVVSRYENILKFDSKAQHIPTRVARAKQVKSDYQKGILHRSINRIRPSDKAIATAENLLQDIIDLITTLHQHKKINDAQLNSMLQSLEYSQLSVEVISGIAQGHQLYNRRDFIEASSHYFQAQKVAMQAKTSDPRRQLLIDEIGEILARKRLIISEELMPETQFNPKPQQDKDEDSNSPKTKEVEASQANAGAV